MAKTSSAVKRRYNLKAYDRIEITVPKGQKAAVERASALMGESVNAYTGKALLARMGLDAWPEDDPQK